MVIAFRARQLNGVAQAVVQGQALGYFPVILDIARKVIRGLVGVRVEGNIAAGRQTKQKGRNRVTAVVILV